MALHERSARLTYEDYVLFPADGLRHEVINGEHFVTAAPFIRHQVLVRRFLLAIGPMIERDNLGELLPAPVDVVLSHYDVVQPDLVFVSQKRRHILTDRNIQGAPDLVIEILSPRTRKVDEVVKLDLYEHSGVEEYWLADAERRSITIHRLEGARFRRIAELSAADVLSTPLLPGLRVDLTDLFG